MLLVRDRHQVIPLLITTITASLTTTTPITTPVIVTFTTTATTTRATTSGAYPQCLVTVLKAALVGGSFDFTGEADKFYCLISDENLAVNAKFGVAYTTGVSVDPDTLVTSLMREQGTVSV